MTQNTVTTDGGESHTDERLEAVEMVRIDRETFKTALQKNYLDERFALDRSRSDVLRLTPPFEAEMQAEHYVSEKGRHYASGPRPIHIRPEDLVDWQHIPEWPTRKNTRYLIEDEGLEVTEGRVDEWLDEAREVFWGEVFARGIKSETFLGNHEREGVVPVEIIDE